MSWPRWRSSLGEPSRFGSAARVPTASEPTASPGDTRTEVQAAALLRAVAVGAATPTSPTRTRAPLGPSWLLVAAGAEARASTPATARAAQEAGTPANLANQEASPATGV